MSPDLRRSVDALSGMSRRGCYARAVLACALCALAWHYLTPGKPGFAPRPAYPHKSEVVRPAEFGRGAFLP